MASNEDKAQELELLHYELTQARGVDAKTKFAPEEPGYGPAECVNCEEPVEAGRRALGFHICAECAQYAEEMRRRNARLYAVSR